MNRHALADAKWAPVFKMLKQCLRQVRPKLDDPVGHRLCRGARGRLFKPEVDAARGNGDLNLQSRDEPRKVLPW
jgi:hypothetical protein